MTRLTTPVFSRMRKLATLSLSMLLASCANFQAIGPANQAISNVSIPLPAGLGQSDDAWPATEWWTSYGDPQLNKLIEHALANNPNLAAAQARIARAQASADLSHTAASPQVNGSVDLSYGRQSENYLVPRPPIGTGGEYVSQGQAAVSFGLDLDLWGRNAALIRAADAQLQSAVYEREATRLALTTSIARAYTQLSAQYDVQDVLSATLEQRRSIRRLIDQRVKNGLDTQVEVRQAETNEAGLRIEIEQLATSIKVTRLQLAALAGNMPSAAAGISRPKMTFAEFRLPIALPMDLLSRRPELAAQRARIEAAYGEADAAKAQFYPNINLNGLIGFQAIGLGNLLSAGSLTNSVGPAIHLPIFDAGRLRANYKGKASDIDAAIAQYNLSVLCRRRLFRCRPCAPY